MIVFRLKEFSYKTIDDVFRLGSRRICIEIMKCVEMFEVGSLTHWLKDKVYGQSIKESYSSFQISPVTLLSPAIEDRKQGQLNRLYNNRNYYKDFINDFSTPLDYINYIKTEVLTETRSGEPKYRKYFDTHEFKYTLNEYMDIYKYIALCLSGQLNPLVDDFDWNIEKRIRPMKVNYTISLNSPIDIIATCIYNIEKRRDFNVTYVSIGFSDYLL